jgi:peptidoglycan/xylan/chitin deacetylase (PgdA/CDA1 family)
VTTALRADGEHGSDQVLRVRIGCDSAFFAKAHYVLTTCAAVWGVGFAAVENDEQADLAYGDVSRDGCAQIPHDVSFAAAVRDLRNLADDGDAEGSARPFVPDSADLIATAFFHLARVEEYVNPAVDTWWRFPAEASLQFEDRRLLECPVDECFDKLFELVVDVRRSRGDAQLERRPLFDASRFAVALTHDVDALRYWYPAQLAAVPYRLARELRAANLVEALREAMAPIRLLRNRRIGAHDPFWNLGTICEIEQEHDARSTFFFLGEHRYDLDGRDGAFYHRRLPEAIEQVRSRGAEVGLHASTRATLSLNALQYQKDYIEQVSGEPIGGVRFHNLLLNVPDSLEHVQRAGFDYDTTLGYAAAEGFRAGSSWPFPLYSLARDKALDVIEVPLAVMDTTFLSRRYQGLSSDLVFRAITTLLERVAQSGGGVSVLWHNSGFDDQLTGGFGTVYRRLLGWIGDEGGAGVTGQAIVDEFRARLGAASAGAAPAAASKSS